MYSQPYYIDVEACKPVKKIYAWGR